MLSGGRSQFIALKAKMPWLDINQERHHAYAGYEGMIELVAEIEKALFNPYGRRCVCLRHGKRQAGKIGRRRKSRLRPPPWPLILPALKRDAGPGKSAPVTT